MFRIVSGFFFLLVLTVQAMAMKPSVAVKFMCESKRLSTSLSREQIKAEPGLYIGKIFELRGRVLGYAETDQGITMMLEDNSKESHCIKVDDRLEENPGTLVALLVKIGPESQYSLSDLQMQFWTYEADVTRIEEASRQAAVSRKARTSSRALTNPRPVISTQPTTVTEMIRVYANAIRGYNRKLTKPASEKLAQAVLGFSQHYKLDPRLVMAVIISESHFRTDAVSGSGAMGLGQLMPSTAAGLGVNNAFDPVDNLYGSIRYIRSMVDRTSGKSWNNMTWQDLSLALAAYNAGPNAVKRHGGVPPYRETQNYVRKVTAIYKQLCGLK
jgi:hypothetical protein